MNKSRFTEERFNMVEKVGKSAWKRIFIKYR